MRSAEGQPLNFWAPAPKDPAASGLSNESSQPVHPVQADSNRDLRVLHVVSRQQRRGAETVALELAREMSVHGILSRVLALGEATSGDPEPTIQLLTRSQQIHGVRTLLLARRLRSALASASPDLVLAHGGQAALVSVLAARSLGIPVLWQRILELPDEAWRFPRRQLWAFVARHVTSVIAITGRVGEEARRLGFTGRIDLEPNHRRWERFASLDRELCRSRLRAELGIPSSARLVGFVGHMVDQKRPETALAVLRALDEADVYGVFVGDGPLLPSLRERIRASQSDERISTLGHRNDVPEILAGLDALVLTSRSETMTGTAIEAQMAGCPIASFALDGIETVIVPNETGLIAPMDDIGALVAATRLLIADPEKGAERAKVARTHARQFGTDLAAARYAAILRAVRRS